eukprot:PhF_6_TR43353/c0_g1_i4/m.66414
MQVGLHKVETHFSTQEGMLVEGVVLDKILAMDRVKYRFRCSTCAAEFCSSCGATPYHIGHTCRDPSEQQLTCRYCNAIISYNPNSQRQNGSSPSVCKDEECLTRARIACNRILGCGHRCGGVMMEPCPPCLNTQCIDKRPPNSLVRQTNEDFCMICYIETLEVSPCVLLQCGHIFHFTCLESRLEKRWPTARITFTFMNCLICGIQIECEALSRLMNPLKLLKTEVERRSLERMRIDGKAQSENILNPDSKYYNNPLLYSYDNYSYYLCSKCGKPFFWRNETVWGGG